ncbi:MAG TPA: hypothetical protein VID94_14080, partial [Acidimicrobiales bacterium]
VSRTTRVGPVDGFWATVDEWAADVVEPSRVRAWWTSRCRLVAVAGPYLDVTGDLTLVERPLTPLRDAVANQGVAVADDAALRSALVDDGVTFRVVDDARRYRWNGPMLTPVAMELHVSGDEATVQAWWEDVWAAWPTIRLGRESTAQRPPRRATPIAQITRLFAALGHEPLQRQDNV